MRAWPCSAPSPTSIRSPSIAMRPLPIRCSSRRASSTPCAAGFPSWSMARPSGRAESRPCRNAASPGSCLSVTGRPASKSRWSSMQPETSVIAIDQGTTGTKVHRLRGDGRFETLAGFEHRQIYPQPGWVEHDPEELGGHVDAALDRAKDAAAIGVANQGETVVAWDAQTKRPIHNAIVWQDARTADITERLKADGAEELTL